MSEEFDPLYKWLGIPPDEQPPHCYRLLGLRVFEENPDAIESAADRLMAYLRTLQTGPNVQIAQEVLNQVAAAKTWLLNPDKKVQYDAWLREQLGPVTPPPPPAAAPPVAGVAPEAAMAGPDLSDVLGGADPYLESRRRSKKTRHRQWLGVVVSLLASIGAAVVVGVVAWKIMGSSEEGTVAVQWPDDERPEGTLEVDGKRVPLAPGELLTVGLPTGMHQVVCTRPGYKPYDVTIAVTAGKTSTVRPVWRDVGEKIDDAKPKASEEPAGATKKAGEHSKSGDEKAGDSTAGKKGEKKGKKSTTPDKEDEDDEDAGEAKKATPDAKDTSAKSPDES